MSLASMVASWARVTWLSGEKVEAPVPEVMPSLYRHMMSS